MCAEWTGSFVTEVVGLRYAEAGLEEGERVELEREPDNPHDPNAIRVVDACGDGCGYLPREEAAWLAPLVDRGWVELEGDVLPGGTPGYRKPIELEVRLTAKGRRAILEPPEPPLAPSEAAHAEVLAAWSEGRLDRRTARRLERRLRERGAPLLPETRLLLRLAPREAPAPRAADAGRALAAVREALAAVEPGEPLAAGGLAVVPLLATAPHELPVRPVAEGIEDGTVVVEEVDGHGSVPELLVRNTGPLPVFVPLGVILVGGKQDRVVARPVVVGPGRTERIAVHCVEEGRWHEESERFRVAAAAPAEVRARAARRGGEPEHEVQAEVWEEVARCLEACEVPSPTMALRDAIERERETLRPAMERLELPESTCGIAAFAGAELVGVELYGAPHLFEPEAGRLLEAFALDTALREGEGAPDPDTVAALLERAAERLRPVRRRGLEIELEADLDGLLARAAVYGDALLALSVLPAA